MSIEMCTPTPAELVGVVEALRDWQREGSPMQLHPGDIGWHWRFGADATSAALRLWRRGGEILAVGLLDGPGLVRLATAPDARRDAELADTLATDLTDPGRAVLPEGPADVEVPADALLRERLAAAGWGSGASWSPLRRDLADPVEQPGVAIDVVGPAQAAARVAVQRAAFDTSTFSIERWRTMTAAAPYVEARCLLATDEQGTPVAAVTVWSAGPGRPGLLEPMGVHRDHRGRGHGRAVTLAAAAALRELGSSSAVVCTPSANAGGVATYRSAGFVPRPEIADLRRSRPDHSGSRSQEGA